MCGCDFFLFRLNFLLRKRERFWREMRGGFAALRVLSRREGNCERKICARIVLAHEMEPLHRPNRVREDIPSCFERRKIIGNFCSRIRFITREKSTQHQVHAFTYVSIIALLLSLYETNRLPLQNPSSNAANATSNGPLKKPKRTPSRRKPKRRKGKRCSNAPKSTSRSTSPRRKI